MIRLKNRFSSWLMGRVKGIKETYKLAENCRQLAKGSKITVRANYLLGRVAVSNDYYKAHGRFLGDAFPGKLAVNTFDLRSGQPASRIFLSGRFSVHESRHVQGVVLHVNDKDILRHSSPAEFMLNAIYCPC